MDPLRVTIWNSLTGAVLKQKYSPKSVFKLPVDRPGEHKAVDLRTVKLCTAWSLRKKEAEKAEMSNGVDEICVGSLWYGRYGIQNQRRLPGVENSMSSWWIDGCHRALTNSVVDIVQL